jgi:hypothetical protein
VEIIRRLKRKGAIWFEVLAEGDDAISMVMEKMGLELMDEYKAMHLVKASHNT